MGNFTKVDFLRRGDFSKGREILSYHMGDFSYHERFFPTMGDFPYHGRFFLPWEIFFDHGRFFRSWEIFPNMGDSEIFTEQGRFLLTKGDLY
mgnify:CR=1 FL=1